MTQYADPRLALLLDVVTLEYLEGALAQEGLSAVCVDTASGPARVYMLGSGETRILLTTGFSLYDYKIVNALALLMINSVRGVRSLEALSERNLSTARIYYYPVVNHFAYSRAIVMAKAFRRSMFDEQGNLVILDNVALLSKYAQILHQIVTNLRPHVVVFLTTDGSSGEVLREPQIRVYAYDPDLGRCVAEALSQVNAQVCYEKDKVRVDRAYTHFVLERVAAVGLEVAIPYADESILSIYRLVLDVIRKVCSLELSQSFDEKCVEDSRVIVSSLGKENINELVRVLKMHGMEAEPISDNRIVVKYCRNVPLHDLLIRERLLEKYFRVIVTDEKAS